MTNASAHSFLLVIALFGFLCHTVSGNNFNLSTAIAPVAHAFHGNQQGFVEKSIHSTLQRWFIVEEGYPFVRFRIACHYHGIGRILAVAPIHNIEKNPCVSGIEIAVPKLVNNQAGRFHQALDDSFHIAVLTGLQQFLVQFCCFQKIRLKGMIAAFPTKNHGKVGLSNPLRPNQREISPGIQRSKCWQILQLVSLFAMKHRPKSKVSKVFGSFFGSLLSFSSVRTMFFCLFSCIRSNNSSMHRRLSVVISYSFAKAAMSSAEKSSFKNLAALPIAW